MVKKIVKYSIFCLILFVMFLCIKIMKRNKIYFELNRHYQFISGLNTLTYADTKNIATKIPYYCGCYFILENEKISNNIGKNANVSVVYKNFDSDILFESTNILKSGDMHGCLIDKKTLYKMFGTEIYIGQKINYMGVNYIVRGIIDSEDPIYVINIPNNHCFDWQFIDGIVIDTSSELYNNQFSNKINASYGEIKATFYIDEYQSIKRWIETPVKWSDFGYYSYYLMKTKNKFKHIMYDDKDVLEKYLIMKSLSYIRIKIEFLLIMIFLFSVMIHEINLKRISSKKEDE